MLLPDKNNNNDDLNMNSNENINNQTTATRKDFQIARRLFHLSVGLIVGTVYGYFLNHQQAVYILGSGLCILYIFEQVRINYPKLAEKIAPVSKFIYRAEEQLKESASIPMIMGILLTILSFPKSFALTAIYTLAVADPMSAIFGIGFGKHHIVKDKSVEGSLAFFICSLAICLFVYQSFGNSYSTSLFIYSFIYALGITAFEMIPLKLDDNLTIPLASAGYQWIMVALFGISF